MASTSMEADLRRNYSLSAILLHLVTIVVAENIPATVFCESDRYSHSSTNKLIYNSPLAQEPIAISLMMG